MPIIPFSQVARHTSSSSCWMVIDSKVYDVTSFLLEHPGGEDILLDSSGRDATREFEDVGHSSDARSQLAELHIGDLRDPTPEEIELAEQEKRERGESDEAQKGGVVAALAKWLLPLFLVGVAYILRKYAK
ncbi:Cytochrome B5 [Gracilaria domingensis]|nr:Cytochrome B5 [Gracilaria domingensis]